MRRSSEQGRTARTKLLATTEAMVAERGREATTVQAIHRRAGISQGSWSHAFPDGKVQAAAEIFDGIHREVWPGVLEPFESGGRTGAAAVIGRSLARLFAYAGDNTARFRLSLSLEHILLLAGRADIVRANNAEIERTLASRAGKVFDAPSDDGKGGGRMLRPIVFNPALAILHGNVELSEMAHRDQLIDALTAAAWAGVRRLCGPAAAAEGTAGSTAAARHKW